MSNNFIILIVSSFFLVHYSLSLGTRIEKLFKILCEFELFIYVTFKGVSILLLIGQLFYLITISFCVHFLNMKSKSLYIKVSIKVQQENNKRRKFSHQNLSCEALLAHFFVQSTPDSANLRTQPFLVTLNQTTSIIRGFC